MYLKLKFELLYCKLIFVMLYGMRYIFLLLFFCVGLSVASQTISKQSISAMGGRLVK